MSPHVRAWRGPRTRSMLLARRLAGVLVVVVSSLALLSRPPAQAASAKVTICHRTHSVTNPYRRITVSVSGVSSRGIASGAECT